MYDFSYHNLFETKGIEYLLTIIFFLLLIPFWLLLNRKHKVAEVQSVKKEQFRWLLQSIPSGLFFHKNHTWIHLKPSGTAKMGLSEMLTKLSKHLTIQPIKQEGETINKGEPLMKIGGGSRWLTVLSPVSGKVGKLNVGSMEHPENMLSEPYGKGWLMEIEPSKWQEETNRFYLADKATAWLQEELGRLKQFVTNASHVHLNAGAAVVLQDGGELSDYPMDIMPESVWLSFQKEFLNQT